MSPGSRVITLCILNILNITSLDPTFLFLVLVDFVLGKKIQQLNSKSSELAYNKNLDILCY